MSRLPVEREQGDAKRVVFLLVSLTYFVLRQAYRTVVELLGRRPHQTDPTVLTYHAVRYEDVGRFSDQMDMLIRKATPVFPDTGAHSNGRRCVAVTFDDAFQNVFEHALPILARHRIPATVFVPTGYLGIEPGWISPARNPQGALGSVAGADIIAGSNRNQVKLGSHSVTHPHLNRLEGDSLRAELATSRRTLEEITGASVTMLALPFGSWSAAVLAEARRAGYDRVYANVPVSRQVKPSLLIGRISVSPGDWPLEFTMKLHGAYEWLSIAIPAKRAILGWPGGSRQP